MPARLLGNGYARFLQAWPGGHRAVTVGQSCAPSRTLMQSTNVSKNDMAEKRRGPAKTKSIGEVILPGGPKGPFSKLSQATMKDNDGVKRTSVALLKYNPGLAKSRQADKQKRNSKKASETEEEQLWSTIPGGTGNIHYWERLMHRHIQAGYLSLNQ